MLSYPHKDIMSEGCCLRHRWCGLGFRHDDRVNLFLCINHPNIRWYGTSVVGWLCLDHNSGWSGETGSLSSLFSFFLLYFGLLISDRLLTTLKLSLPLSMSKYLERIVLYIEHVENKCHSFSIMTSLHTLHAFKFITF